MHVYESIWKEEKGPLKKIECQLYTFYSNAHTKSPGPSGEFSIKVTHLKRHVINTLNASRTWLGGEAG